MLAVKNDLSSIAKLLLDNKADILFKAKKRKICIGFGNSVINQQVPKCIDQLLAHSKKNSDNPLYDEFIWTAIEIANREDKDHLKLILFSMLDLKKQSIRFAKSASTEESSRLNLILITLRDSLAEIAHSYATQWVTSVIPLSRDIPTPFISDEWNYSSNTLSRREKKPIVRQDHLMLVFYLQIMKILLEIIFQIMKIIQEGIL